MGGKPAWVCGMDIGWDIGCTGAGRPTWPGVGPGIGDGPELGTGLLDTGGTAVGSIRPCACPPPDTGCPGAG